MTKLVLNKVKQIFRTQTKSKVKITQKSKYKAKFPSAMCVGV